eukprot:scaffold267743_cov24-Attheya_sp.AAC.1
MDSQNEEAAPCLCRPKQPVPALFSAASGGRCDCESAVTLACNKHQQDPTPTHARTIALYTK